VLMMPMQLGPYSFNAPLWRSSVSARCHARVSSPRCLKPACTRRCIRTSRPRVDRDHDGHLFPRNPGLAGGCSPTYLRGAPERNLQKSGWQMAVLGLMAPIQAIDRT
jgi:hypothetical protein